MAPTKARLGSRIYNIHKENLVKFFRLMAERHEIHIRRRAGQSPPWTCDPILQNYRFCNVFRALDRITQYLMCHVIGGGSQEPQDTIFRIFIFRLFNRESTWELLQQELDSSITISSFCRKKYRKILGQAFDAGEKLYCGAYIIPSPKIAEHQPAFENHLLLLERIKKDNTVLKLLACSTMEDAHAVLTELPGIGDFIAYQLVLDINLTTHVDWDENQFTADGPGSRSGARLIFGNSLDDASVVHAIRFLYNSQAAFWKTASVHTIPSLVPNSTASSRKGVCLPDIEHSLCEFSKYMRLNNPNQHTMQRRYVCDTRPLSYQLPKQLTPSSDSIALQSSSIVASDEHLGLSEQSNKLPEVIDLTQDDSEQNAINLIAETNDSQSTRHNYMFRSNLSISTTKKHLSNATASSKTKTFPPIQCDVSTYGSKYDDIDYEVSHIVAQRQGYQNIVEYRVRWVGYRAKDDTWLTEAALSNAPEALKDWKRHCKV